MNIKILRAIVFTLLLAPNAGWSNTLPADDAALFEAYLDGVVAAQFSDYQLAGMTFALVRNGQLVLSKGYGFADLENKIAVDPARHLFRPGSTSKLFTWTAVMQLVEQGKLDLNAPVADYIHQFEIPNEFNQPLTLTHILTHSPGFEDGALGYLFADNPEDLVPLADSLAAHVPNQIWAPGTYSAYSNFSTALAGLAVANVSGLSFEEYIAKNILEPLGMAHATFEEPLPERFEADMSIGYTIVNGGLQPLGFEYIKNFGPAGALSATAEDMARFIIAHVSQGAFEGTRILKPETTDLMHSRLFAHHPAVAGMAHGFYEIRRNGQRFIGHGGDTIVFHSELVIEPNSDFGFFLSFNAADGGVARQAVTNAVLDYFFPGDGGEAPVIPAEPLAGSDARIKNIIGAYRLNRRSYTQLEALPGLGGDLAIEPAGDGAIKLNAGPLSGRFVEVEPFVFRQQGRQELLVFQADEQGKVSRGFIGSLPIMVAEKLTFAERASTHQLVIMLTLLAALFVLINATRSRGGVKQTPTTGAALWAKRSLVTTAIINLSFAVSLTAVFIAADTDRLIFDFPPAGTAAMLVLPILSIILTAVCVLLLVPVWRTPACSLGQRIRYSYVTTLFVLFLAVLGYWNLIGWNY